jgi:uncharacterized protein with FMN-binding domain
MSDNVQEPSSNLIPSIAILTIVIIIISVGSFQLLQGRSPAPIAPTPTTSQTLPSSFKEGSYSATGSYTSPGGQEEIDVTITISSDGIVSDTTVTPKSPRPISKAKQEDFAAHYKTFVVGKNINEINLTKVSGSSLTPKGFNDALTKIMLQAKG